MADSMLARLEESILQIVGYLPQLAAAAGILIAGAAIAKMIERGTESALKKVGFDRWMEDGGVSEALERTGAGLRASIVIAKLVFWTVMVLVILLVADALGLPVVSALFVELIGYIPNVIVAVIILVLGLVLGEFVKDITLASAGAVEGVTTLAQAAKGVIVVLAIFMALEQLEIAEDIVLVAFISVMGATALATGIAFGLGGRDVAADVISHWYQRGVKGAAAAAASSDAPEVDGADEAPEEDAGA